jgi:hypothetical protein
MKSGLLAGDCNPVVRETIAAVVKAAHFAMPPKAALGNIGIASRIVAAVVGLGKVAKLHSVAGSTRGPNGSVGDGVRMERPSRKDRGRLGRRASRQA